MIPASATSLDVAVWFLDRARTEDTYIPPRKLQCLLFLAQAHFAARFGGRPLIPSFFIVDEGGPMDPNLYRILENGRPDFTQTPLPEEVQTFLGAIWRRYRDADALRLDQIIARQGANEEAVTRRNRSEITIEAMRRMFGRDGTSRNDGPKVARTYYGREVTVTRWTPARKSTVR
jgi:uncharacterized phage-associated protein